MVGKSKRPSSCTCSHHHGGNAAHVNVSIRLRARQTGYSHPPILKLRRRRHHKHQEGRRRSSVVHTQSQLRMTDRIQDYDGQVATQLPPTDPTPGAQIARQLLESVDALSEKVATEIETVDQPYYIDALRMTREQLRGCVRDNITAILRQLAGDGALKLGVARATGRLKAELGVPLDVSLHVYRIAGRMVWSRLVDGAGD